MANTTIIGKISRGSFLEWARSQLGNFYFPLSEFELQTRALIAQNPELNDNEAAAVIYFSMLAESPQPSTEDIIFIPYFTDNMSASDLLSTETKIYDFNGSLPHSEKVHPKQAPFANTPLTFMQVQRGEFDNEWEVKNIYHYENGEKVYLKRKEFDGEFIPKYQAWNLQKYKLELYLSKLGLMEGIKKTLSEQSRRAQAGEAQAAASKQAAAYAAAMAKQAKEEAESARIEAAKAEAAAKAQAEAAAKDEKTFREQLDNISNGLPADYKKPNTALFFGGIAAACMVLYFIGRGSK